MGVRAAPLVPRLWGNLQEWSSPFTEEHRRLNAHDCITPNMFIIEFVAGTYVEYKYLELIPVHIVV